MDARHSLETQRHQLYVKKQVFLGMKDKLKVNGSLRSLKHGKNHNLGSEVKQT
jgi:hypothetical protein